MGKAIYIVSQNSTIHMHTNTNWKMISWRSYEFTDNELTGFVIDIATLCMQ